MILIDFLVYGLTELIKFLEKSSVMLVSCSLLYQYKKIM